MRTIAFFPVSFCLLSVFAVGCVAGGADEAAALSEDSLTKTPVNASGGGPAFAIGLPGPRKHAEQLPAGATFEADATRAVAAGSCSWTTFMTWPKYDANGTAIADYTVPRPKVDALGVYYEVSHATLARKNFGSLVFGLALNGYPPNRDVYVTLVPVGAPEPRKMAIFTYWVTDFSAPSGVWNGLHLVTTWGPQTGVYADQLQNGMFRVEAQIAGARLCTGGFRMKLVP